MRQTRIPLFVIAIALSMALACSRTDKADSSAGSKPSEASAIKTAPNGVKLVSAGRSPFSQPRFKFEVGQTQDAELTNQLKVRTTLGIQPMPESVSPPVTYHVRLEAKDVSPEGTAKLHFQVIDAKVQAVQAIAPEAQQQMQRAAAGLVGLSGSYSADNLGRIQDFKFTESPQLQAAEPGMLQNLERLIDTILIPLPEQKIGMGAKWTYASSFDEQGAKVRQASTYEITEIGDDKLHARFTTDRHADKQKVPVPGGTAEQTYELLSLESSGSGRSETMLYALVPNLSTMSTKATMKLLLPGQEGEAAQSMQLEMLTQSSVRAK